MQHNFKFFISLFVFVFLLVCYACQETARKARSIPIEWPYETMHEMLQQPVIPEFDLRRLMSQDSIKTKLIWGTIINGKKEGYWHFLHTNETLKIRGAYLHDKRNGWWEFYGENENLLACGHFENDKKSGFWKFYYPGKTIHAYGHFKNDKAEGNWDFFDENAQLVYSIDFFKGNMYGNFKRYKNNLLLEEGYVKNGYKSGVWKYYDNTGNIVKIIDYR